MSMWKILLGLLFCSKLYAQSQSSVAARSQERPAQDYSHYLTIGLKAVTAKAQGNIFESDAASGLGLHVGLLPKADRAENGIIELGLSLELDAWTAKSKARPSALFDPEETIKVRLSRLYWDICNTRTVVVCVGLPLAATAEFKQSSGDRGTEVDLTALSLPVRLLALHNIDHWQLGFESAVAAWSLRVQGTRAATQIWSHALFIGYSL